MKLSFIYLVIIVLDLSSLIIAKKFFKEESTKEYQVTNEIEQLQSFISINPFNKKYTVYPEQAMGFSKCNTEKVTGCIIKLDSISKKTKWELLIYSKSNYQEWKNIINNLLNDNNIADDINKCMDGVCSL